MIQLGSLNSLAAMAVVLLTGLAAPAGAQTTRDNVNIVGSSTVFPFSTVVAERFGRSSGLRAPKVEATGSGGGFKLFCDGIGVAHPDIANSSRRIKRSELDACMRNGVDEIVEVKIGYDGIVIANNVSAESVALTRREIFLALARDVPSAEPGRLIPNPYQNWRDIAPHLPDRRIEVLGPPPTSGTRDTFVELAMEGGCVSFGWITDLLETDLRQYREICQTIREDGVYIEAGENDNLIVQKLQANPRAFGIFGFNFLDQNPEKVKGVVIDGIAPTFDEIADGRYPVSRPLYIYVKKAHVDLVPGMRGFLREFTSERAWGDEGYLSERGLIPLAPAERFEVAAAVMSLIPLTLATD